MPKRTSTKKQLKVQKLKRKLKKEFSVKRKYLTKYKDIKVWFKHINDTVFEGKLSPFGQVEIKNLAKEKCYWPDCSNCCSRQGRLPLTSDDLITIGTGMKYQKTSDFIKNETVIATWQEPSPGGGFTTLTGINLKRKEDETEANSIEKKVFSRLCFSKNGNEQRYVSHDKRHSKGEWFFRQNWRTCGSF